MPTPKKSTQQKFGLCSVRVPSLVLASLHFECKMRAVSSQMRYCVRRTTTKEQKQKGGESHVTYLCNAAGARMPGASLYFFTPMRYQRRKPAATAPTQPVKPQIALWN